MGLGSGRHGKIIRFLTHQFEVEIETSNRSWIALQGLIGIRSPRAGRWDTCRIPDITIVEAGYWESLDDDKAIIELKHPRPYLVVEVVSESTHTTDYRAKRSEYAVLGIQEYWIVDLIKAVVIVLELIDGLYEAKQFSEEQEIESKTFSNLQLTARYVLNAVS